LLAPALRIQLFILIQPRGVEHIHRPTDLAGLNPLTFDPNRRDGNIKAALGPACNQIRDAMKKQGPVAKTVEQVASELDEKSLSVLSFFGRVPYFSRPLTNEWPSATTS
jgi:hypothetical protein